MENSICKAKFTTITVGGSVRTWAMGHEPRWVKHVHAGQCAEHAIMDAHYLAIYDGGRAAYEIMTNEYVGLLADMSARRIVDSVIDDILLFCD